jgi:AcrR family transcriptional regulator
MSRTRSRAKTEEKFLNATLELIAQDGCGALGINAIANHAGADKVLIYRYFGNMNGLLERVAHCRQWLPSVDELTQALTIETNRPATGTMHQLARHLTQHIHSDRTTTQLLRWRKAVHNPLTEHFSSEWKELWQNIADYFSNGLDYAARTDWKHLTTLMALSIETDLCEEAISSACIDFITRDIFIGEMVDPNSTEATRLDDQLPTNLL